MICKKLATLNDAASVKNVSCHKAFFKVKKGSFYFFFMPKQKFLLGYFLSRRKLKVENENHIQEIRGNNATFQLSFSHQNLIVQ